MDLHILHEPQLCTAILLMALTSRINLLDLVNLNFSVFCKVFLKMRKF